MDAVIEKAVVQAREVARMHLQWKADEVRLTLGQARPLARNEKPFPGEKARMLPLFNGYCFLLVDVPPGAENPIYDQVAAVMPR